MTTASKSAAKLHLRSLGRRGPLVIVAMALLAFLAPAIESSNRAGAAIVSHEQIEGAGSSWAANSIQQWISDVRQRALQVVYTPSGSATGRKDFAQGVTDFAVSDIGFLGRDPVSGADDTSSRPYAYLPVVGGGTSFPYHVAVAGQLVRNLRLSQETLAMIFTNQITNWNDPHISADNNGRQLPSIPIIPVVHSEGAGTTYQITDWLNSTFPAMWQRFSSYNFPVEYWPSGKGSQVAESGSDSVMNFISSAAGNGSIGFVEYSYPLGANYPVVKIENTAGYFTAPDQYNVAVALTQAQINYDKTSKDYLLEKLNNVWTYNDPRTYPLSSYSYFIEPTSGSDPTVDTGKRQTIVDYLTYSLCQGQAEMGPIGYSPLPINLVQASFQQLQILKQADPNVSEANVDVTQCNNPTFDPSNLNANKLALIAPMPPACDHVGQGPCVPGAGIHLTNPIGNSPTGPAAGASGSGRVSSTAATSSSAAAPAAVSSGASGSAATASTDDSASGNGSDNSQSFPLSVVTNLDASHLAGSVGAIAAALILLVLLLGPPLWARSRRKRQPGEVVIDDT